MPTLYFLLSILGSVYSNELKIIFNSIKMDLQQYISTFFLVAAGVSISYSFYIRTQKKIIALKEFRDKEQIRVLNYIHTQIKMLEDKINGDDVLSRNELLHQSNYLLHESQSNEAKLNEIKLYNDSFKDWGLKEYKLDLIHSYSKD